MRDLDLPSQSWPADDTPDQSTDIEEDNSQARSLHYGG
jgi:hypothetical protein